MGLFNKIKSLFEEKKVSVDQVNQVLGVETPIQEEKPEVSEEQKEEFEEIKLEKQELFQLLDSVKINPDSLALDRIESESETLSSYCKGLIKDLGNYHDFKNEKEKQELAIKSISGKIKVINNHGLELKNLLATLEDHYYTPIIEVLKRVYEKSEKDELKKLIESLEKDLNLVKELDSQITKVISYHELFSQEKNPKYKEEIEKEVIKRIIHEDLNDLLSKILMTIVDKSISIKVKIQRTNPLQKAKRLI